MKFAKIMIPLGVLILALSLQAQVSENSPSDEGQEALLLERLNVPAADSQLASGDLTDREVELLYRFAEISMGLDSCSNCSEIERKGRVREFFRRVWKWIEENIEPVDVPLP